jgi:hypothetical protein
MFSKFNKEQLEKLALYATGMNAILLEALLSVPPESEDGETNIKIYVVERGREPEPRTAKKE